VILGEGDQKLPTLANDGSISKLTMVDDTCAPFLFDSVVGMVFNAQGHL
jgi:hypothetical protein